MVSTSVIHGLLLIYRPWMDETFTKIVTMRTIFYLIHKTIAILVLGKLRVRVFQTREHIGQTAADQQKGVGGAIQSSMLSRRQSGRGGDSHLEILGTLSRCADARVNRRLNNTGVLQRQSAWRRAHSFIMQIVRVVHNNKIVQQSSTTTEKSI